MSCYRWHWWCIRYGLESHSCAVVAIAVHPWRLRAAEPAPALAINAGELDIDRMTQCKLLSADALQPRIISLNEYRLRDGHGFTSGTSCHLVSNPSQRRVLPPYSRYSITSRRHSCWSTWPRLPIVGGPSGLTNRKFIVGSHSPWIMRYSSLK